MIPAFLEDKDQLIGPTIDYDENQLNDCEIKFENKFESVS